MSRQTRARGNFSAKDRFSSQTQPSSMEDRSSTHTFQNRHHRPPFHLAAPGLQSPEAMYPSSQHPPDSLDPYASRAQSGRILNASGLDTDGGPLDGGGGELGCHFADAWYDSAKREEPWDATEDFYGKSGGYGSEGFYGREEAAARRGVRAGYGGYCDAKADPVYAREAAGGESGVDYCRADSRMSEGDFGSSGGSCEGQLQATEAEQGPWLNFSPEAQAADGKWRGGGGGDGLALASGSFPVSGAYPQKLDSFSEAFLSQRKTKFSLVPSGGPSVWDLEKCRDKAGHGWAFDSDAYLPHSSPSPGHPSLPSFPSPPTSSHLMASVLSPPPTPLPPPSHSPTKMDSPGASGGAAYSPSQLGEAVSAPQFFTSRLQALTPGLSSGMKWKFPMVHHFPQSSDDPGALEGSLRAAHGPDYHSFPASHDILQSPESPFLTSPSHQPCFKASRAVALSSAPSLHSAPAHRPPRPALLSGQHSLGSENIVPHMGTKTERDGKTHLTEPRPQKQSLIYTGIQFSSLLQSGRGTRRGHYTPRPLLNPTRRGTGLFSSVSPAAPTGGNTEEEECALPPSVNIGADFQAVLPPCFEEGKGSKVWPLDEESPWEQLLWRPFGDLEENINSQNQVEKLLLMCSSSCLTGGGSNSELALHCLHHCEGRTMATLEMLLLTRPSPAGDYHYSGSDVWTDSEKNLFTAAQRAYGKDFSLIQKMVSTKTVRQCVEFFYLSKKLQDKQQKQMEEEIREEEVEQRKSTTPICQPVDRHFLEEAAPVPSLASFFPCKLCGKMFYKIKSRNAHMKIHRQPQEDWVDRRLQHQLLTQRLALSRPGNLLPTPGNHLLQPQPAPLAFPGLGGTPNGTNAESTAGVLHPSTLVAYNNIGAPNAHMNASVEGADSKQREPGVILPFHQSWGSFGHSPDRLYCDPEGKDGADIRGMKEQINWQ